MCFVHFVFLLAKIGMICLQDSESSDLFQKVFEVLPDVALVLNEDNLTIVYANQKFSKSIIDRKQVIGESFISKILNKSGGIDFLDSLSIMKRDALTEIVAERVETIIHFLSDDGKLLNIHQSPW